MFNCNIYVIKLVKMLELKVKKKQLNCMSEQPLLLSPDDPSLLASYVTVNACSLRTETLKRISVTLWDHSAEQRSNVPGAGLLGAWPSAGHTGEVSLAMSILSSDFLEGGIFGGIKVEL